MASTITIEYPVIAYRDGGENPTQLNFLKATGETWSYGDILKFDTSVGKAAKAAAGDAILLGIALSDNPFLTRTDVTEYPVLVFTRGIVLEMNVWANNNSDSSNVITQANIGNKFDLAISGGSLPARYVVDIGNTTDQIFKVEGGSGRIGGGIIGDYYQRILVRLVDSALGWEA